jgi:hypothetical protein
MSALSFGTHDPREPVNLSVLAMLALRQIKDLSAKTPKLQAFTFSKNAEEPRAAKRAK